MYSSWPPVFYADFTSRIWLTYCSRFKSIRDVRLEDLDWVESVSVSGSAVGTYSSWPPVFYADLTSRIWLTYCSRFKSIRDVRLEDLDWVESVSVSGSAVGTYSSWPPVFYADFTLRICQHIVRVSRLLAPPQQVSLLRNRDGTRQMSKVRSEVTLL
ncbi:hypothetical protein H2248_005595 [Termitomyces sp. 'cryptogamus']|nr:hypothetical protein H2248_005595 [Termitomyces sp. 'cryptogamus']